MNMAMSVPTGTGEFARQARVARTLGSPFVGAVLEAGQRQLFLAPRTAALLADWPGDPSASALAMRFNAALHAVARRGAHPGLSALYRREHDDFDREIGAAMAAEDGFIATWMRDTPQTNEVGRAGAFAAALMLVRRQFGYPFELLELGSSCGLNLNLARYAYDLGGVAAGAANSPVRVAPLWRGNPPPSAPIDVIAARGVDLNPLSAGSGETRERLLSFVWADQPTRAARLERALDLARHHVPMVDRGNAVPWLAAHLEAPQTEGRCRVLLHSMVLQYLSAPERRTVLDLIDEAGSRASPARPFAHIGLEWTPNRSEVQLRLTCWPNGQTRLLARCHAYGDWIEWLLKAEVAF